MATPNTTITGFRANPGGTIPPDQTLGRAALVKRCWRALEGQSIRLENERRLGKTSVIRLMVATPPEGTRCIFMEVGGLSSVSDFIDEVLKRVDAAFPEKSATLRDRFKKLVNNVRGVEVVGLRIPESLQKSWRELLDDTLRLIADVVGERVIFFWDEMPWMLQKISERSNSDDVVDLLDTLRDFRQTHETIRMVYTGSIGFHHVLSRLEDDGMAGSPVNDMVRIEVPPLASDDARELAKRLLIGEGIETTDLDGIADALQEQTGGIAFYIHHVVSALALDDDVSVDLVTQKIEDMLTDPADPWEMRHFDKRLPHYFREWAPAARILLDAMAQSPEPLPFADLITLFEQSGSAPRADADKHDLLNLLRKLMLDHYVAEAPRRHYGFKFPLLKRWWMIQRGLDL